MWKLHSFLLQLNLHTYKAQVSEHQGVSPKTGKGVKHTLFMSARDYILDCNHTVTWEDFSITGRESNRYLLETKETLFIK